MTKYSTLANEIWPYLLPKVAKVGGRNGNGGTGVTLLSQLGDVQLSSLADNDFLSYDTATGKWINVDAPAGGGGGSYTAGWGIDIDGSDVIAVDVPEIVNINSGLEVTGVAGSEQIAINLQASSGLVANSSGLALDSNLAGDGLEMTAGKIMSVTPKPDGGLDVDAAGVFVKLPTSSGLHLDSTGLWFHRRGDLGLTSGLSMSAADGVYLADAMAGDGLMWESAPERVLMVDEDFNFVWTGTHTFDDNVTLNANGTFNTGVFTFNTDPQIAANLHFLGSARSITSAATLTLTPTGNLHLDPSGNITMPNAQVYRSTTINDLPTGIDGINIFNRSDFSANYVQMTIGAIKSDELHVRIFTADETRINRGEEYWSKSFGIVQEDFNMPGVGVNVDVWFEDAPGMAGANLFAANDWLLLRSINWGTGLVVSKVWLQVVGTKLAQETTAVHGVDRQQWRLVRRAGGWTTTGASNKIKAGNVMLDAGQVGQGWVHLSALASDGGPFIQFGKMTSVATVPDHSNYVRIGNLKNTVGYSVDTWGMAAGNNLGLDRNLGEFSGFVIEAEEGLSLYNTDLTIYDGATKTVSLNRTQGLVLRNDVDALTNLDRQINWYDDIDDTVDVPRTAIGSYIYDNSGMPTRQMEIFVTGVSAVSSAQIVAIRAIDPNAGRNTSITQFTRTELSTGATGSTIELFANEVQIQSKLLVGGELDETSSIARLHVVESTTAINQLAGFLVEQKSTGDAVIHWRLTTPNRYYSMGIDNSDGDKFKISASASLGTSDFFVYDPATGLVTVSGLTGGGGGGGGTYTAGSGITIVGTEIAVDGTVVRTTQSIIAGDGLTSGGLLVGDVTLNVGAGAGISVTANSVSVSLASNSGLDTVGGLHIDSSFAGDGLTLTSGILDVVALSTGGLQANANSIQVKLRSAGSGLQTDADGLWIYRRGNLGQTSGISMTLADGIWLADTVAGDGLEWSNSTDRVLQVKPGNGLELSGTSPGMFVRVMLPADSGLVRDATGIYVDSAIAGNGLVMTAGVIDVVPSATGGLAVSANSVSIILPASSGLQTDATGLWLYRRGNLGTLSGLSMTAADGIWLADTVAGAGLEWTSSTDRFMQLALGSGLEFSDGTADATVRVKLPSNSGLLRDGTGLYVNPTIAGDGLIMTSGIIDVVPTNASITVGTNGINVNLGHTYAWTGSHTFSTGVTTFNTDPQVNANLDFLGARSITSNSTNAITIAAGGNLILASAGDLARSTSFSDLVTGISGFRMWDRGANYIQLTIGAMKMDELYARVFVADEVRIDRGEEYWSKSFGVVETDFVLPADEATVNVWFENSPGLAAANLFSVGDWLLLRAIDWGTSLAIYKVWFTVTALLTAGSVDGYRQRWTIKRETGGVTGLTIKKGGVMLDAGQIGQGWIHLSALAQDGGPFIQIGDFTSIVSSDTPTFTNRVRMGNLSGAAGITGTFWGFAAGNDLSLDASLGGFSGFTVGKGIGSPGTNYDGLRLYNTDLNFYDGTEKIISLNKTYGLSFLHGDGGTVDPKRAIVWSMDATTPNVTTDHYSRIASYRHGGSADNILVIESVSQTLNGELWLQAEGNDGSSEIKLVDNVITLTATTINLSGTIPTFTATNITANTALISNTLKARTAAGLSLTDAGGTLGIFVENGGAVGIGSSAPPSGVQLHVAGTGIIRANTAVRTPLLSTLTADVTLALLDSGKTVVVGNSTYVEPFSGFTAQNNVMAIVRQATSTGGANTPFAGFVFANNQSGTAHNIAQLMFMNEAIVSAEKRVAQMLVQTDGATNSGKYIFRVYNAGTLLDAMTITSSGLVGLGMTPASDLDIVQTTSEGLRMTAAAEARLVMRRSLGTLGSPSQVTNGTPIVLLGAQGYTSSGWPAAGAYDATIEMEATESHTSGARGTLIRFKTTANGANTPTYRLQIGQDGLLYYPGGYSNTVSSVPNMTIASDGTFVRTTHANSSLRYKEDVRTLAPDAYSGLFDALQPVSYKLKREHGGDGRTLAGLIAEDVEAAGGGAFVQYDEQGRPDVLMYDRLIVVLIAEIQRLKKRMSNWEGGI